MSPELYAAMVKATKWHRAGKELPTNLVRRFEAEWIGLVDCDSCGKPHYSPAYTNGGDYCHDCRDERYTWSPT
jgi:hypothetical protein